MQVTSLFQLENKYTDFFDLKRKVIERSVKEINAKTNLQVAYDAKRTGRKVTDIRFTFVDRLSIV